VISWIQAFIKPIVREILGSLNQSPTEIRAGSLRESCVSKFQVPFISSKR
jgi:hypothetical protein